MNTYKVVVVCFSMALVTENVGWLSLVKLMTGRNIEAEKLCHYFKRLFL